MADVATAVLGDVGVLAALLGLAGLAVGGARTAAAAVAGPAVVLVSTAVGLGLVLLAGERAGRAPAALMLAYVLKVALALAVLLLVPWPAQWPRPWFLGGALAGVALMLITEVRVVRRLRIPYFVPAPPTAEPGASRGVDHDAERSVRG